MQLGQGLVARRLGAAVLAQQAAHLAEHGGGLGAAAQGDGEVGVECAGEAEAVGGVCLEPDDVGGEPSLQRVGGVQGGDRAHGVVVAGGAGFRGVGGEHLEGGAEPGEHLAGGGVWEVREGKHDGGRPLAAVKGADVGVRVADVNG
jgi:hypothetical protein